MNKRSFSRSAMSINIHASHGSESLGHVLDLTERGLCLGGVGMAPTSPLPLTLRLPWPVNGVKELHMQADPRWYSYANDGHWRAGLRIHGDEQTALTLAALAAKYGQ